MAKIKQIDTAQKTFRSLFNKNQQQEVSSIAQLEKDINDAKGIEKKIIISCIKKVCSR